MTFEEKARAMSAREIILTAIDAAENPSTDVLDMGTFGEVNHFGEICGCIATNAAAKIAGIKFTAENITSAEGKAEAVGATDKKFFYDFRTAIDALRRGAISTYNGYAEKIGIAKIKQPDFQLWWLSNDFDDEMLEPYKRLAEIQDEEGGASSND